VSLTCTAEAILGKGKDSEGRLIPLVYAAMFSIIFLKAGKMEQHETYKRRTQ